MKMASLIQFQGQHLIKKLPPSQRRLPIDPTETLANPAKGDMKRRPDQ